MILKPPTSIFKIEFGEYKVEIFVRRKFGHVKIESLVFEVLGYLFNCSDKKTLNNKHKR